MLSDNGNSSHMLPQNGFSRMLPQQSELPSGPQSYSHHTRKAVRL